MFYRAVAGGEGEREVQRMPCLDPTVEFERVVQHLRTAHRYWIIWSCGVADCAWVCLVCVYKQGCLDAGRRAAVMKRRRCPVLTRGIAVMADTASSVEGALTAKCSWCGTASRF